MNQIQGKVWHSISTKEAWINLGKRQGVLPGMMLFFYDPSGSAPYVRVPEVRVVEVLQERSRVTVANPNFDGLYGGLVVASGRLPASR